MMDIVTLLLGSVWITVLISFPLPMSFVVSAVRFSSLAKITVETLLCCQLDCELAIVTGVSISISLDIYE